LKEGIFFNYYFFSYLFLCGKFEFQNKKFDYKLGNPYLAQRKEKTNFFDLSFTFRY